MSANWSGGLGSKHYPTFFTLWAKRCNLPFKISHIFQRRQQAEAQSVILQGTSTTYFQVCLQYCVPANFLHPWYNLLLAREENDERPPGNEKRWESLPSTHAASPPISYREADLELCSFYGLKFWFRHSRAPFPSACNSHKGCGSGAHSDHAVLCSVLSHTVSYSRKKSIRGKRKKSFQLPSQNLLGLPLSLHICP